MELAEAAIRPIEGISTARTVLMAGHRNRSHRHAASRGSSARRSQGSPQQGPFDVTAHMSRCEATDDGGVPRTDPLERPPAIRALRLGRKRAALARHLPPAPPADPHGAGSQEDHGCRFRNRRRIFGKRHDDALIGVTGQETQRS